MKIVKIIFSVILFGVSAWFAFHQDYLPAIYFALLADGALYLMEKGSSGINKK